MSELRTKQLYEKVDGEYIPFNPLVSLDSIKDSVTKKSIEFIFSHYNHFNANWTNNSELTRAQVPPQLRRKNLWLSYNVDDKRLVTERYIGTDIQASVYEHWVDDAYWEELDFELLMRGVEEAVKNIFQNLNKYPQLRDLIRKLLLAWLNDNIDGEWLKELIEAILGDDVSDLIKSILLEYFNSPDFKKYILTLFQDLIDGGLFDKIIQNYLDEHISEYIDNSIKNYFNGDDGKDRLKEVVAELLEDIMPQFFAEIQQAFDDFGRVTANALARHEMNLTEINTQLGL